MKEVGFHTNFKGRLMYISFSIPKFYPNGKELTKKDAERYIKQMFGFDVVHWMEF